MYLRLSKVCQQRGKPRRNQSETYYQLCSLRARCPLTLWLTFRLWESAKHRDCRGEYRTEFDETLAKAKARDDADSRLTTSRPCHI